MGRPAVNGRLALVVIVVPAVALLVTADRADPPAPSVSIELAGPRQVVFDWSREACEPTQAADLAARAFRDDRGRVQLLLSHFDNFRMIGPSLNHLHVDCEPVMTSAQNADPSAYRDREWIASPYTEDGRNVWALVHDEYQGNRHPGRCPQGTYHPCWYNAITLAVSRDRGRSFHHPRHSGHLVASPPYRYRAGEGPVGIFAPSNIVKQGKDGLHAFFRFRDPDGRRGACLIRSDRISSASSWRAWTGDSFDGGFSNPYRQPNAPHTDCDPISPVEIGQMAESLSFDTAAGLYLLVGMAADRTGGRPRDPGIYLSSSYDLVHWAPRKLLMQSPTIHTYRCGARSPIAYPALLDPSSPSRNFSSSDGSAYLYFTQLRYRNCEKTPNRDLIRVRVRISD
jgi:hypothetical protein